VVARAGAGLVLMHMRGTPETMQDAPPTTTTWSTRSRELAARSRRARKRRRDRPGRIVVDPGIGFAKTPAHNLELLARPRTCSRRSGRPVLLGVSRKAFLGALLGGAPPEERDVAPPRRCVAGLLRRRPIFRVHDVPRPAGADVAEASASRRREQVSRSSSSSASSPRTWKDLSRSSWSPRLLPDPAPARRHARHPDAAGAAAAGRRLLPGAGAQPRPAALPAGDLFEFGAIAALVVFQPELRSALAHLGQNRMAALLQPAGGDEVAEEIAQAAEELARAKVGAIIAIEREVGLGEYAETGTPLQARVSAALLNTIFTPYSPLHDGAVIIRGDMIVAAGAILPLTQFPVTDKSLGTRHRAALGLSEETDALVIVVSEETRGLPARTVAFVRRPGAPSPGPHRR
jgi:hypothetical protein